MIGTDYRWKTGWMAGIMASHGQSTGSYNDAGTKRDTEAQLTGIYPYASYQASEWGVWVSGGYGWGHAEVQDLKKDLNSRFGAVGFKGNLATIRTSQLRYYGDVLYTDAEIEQEGLRAEVVRVRLGMESAFEISDRVRPYVEANVRQDAGDAETGIGIELGGGLRVAYPQWNLRGEVRSQALVLHSADGFTEWGVSGSIEVGNASKGFMMRVRPSYGPSHHRSLYRQQTIADAMPYPSGMHRTEVELGYGRSRGGGTARSSIGLTALPKGRLLRLGGQVSPWNWTSLSLSGLAHQRQSSIGDVSVNVQGTLRY